MSRRRAQGGFVLVVTLWILAAVAIAASYFAERVQKSLQLAELRQGANDSQIALSDARAELLFRLATLPLTPGGLGDGGQPIALDGRVYSLGSTTVAFQDGRGLFNLNFFADDQMQRFLATLGVPGDQQARLIDILRDYTDEDSLRRLNGAEAPQYAEAGLPPPRNAALLSPIELRNLIGWRDTPALAGNPLLNDLTTADSSRALNPNTAPWQVLTSLPGVTEPVAKALIERRRIEPISGALLDSLLGAQLQMVPPVVIAFPSDNLRITQGVTGLPWVLRYNVQLTPRGSVSPWQITYFYRLERTVDAGPAPHPPNASDPPKLPPRPDTPASAPLLLAN